MYDYHKKSNHLLLYILIAGISFLLGWQLTAWGFLAEDNGSQRLVEIPEFDRDNVRFELDDEAKADLSLFWLVWQELEDKYVRTEKINYSNMVYGAIKGMVDSLEDPYTVFMDPSESEQFNASLHGTLEGIGAELTIEDQLLTVVSPLRDSPAEKAGILPGDVIFKIDGEIAADMTLFDAIMSIRGEKDTPVVLTIVRESVDEPFDVTIVRDSIDLDSVTKELLEENIAYVSINQFNERTRDEFAAALSELILDPPAGLILDLRFNGGGYLNSSVDILSFLLPEDQIAVKIEERGQPDDILYTEGQTRLTDVPMVVLVNEGSASASEIVAGALQDYERAVIMGTQTFGKGSVQEVEQFADGSSIRLTVARWFTPNGTNVDHEGLAPDIVVEIDENDAENNVDTQRNAAIEYLKAL